MKHIKRFNEKLEENENSNEIEKFIGKNKKTKSSYEMYKILREKGFKEKDLKDYFYDNY
jgi:hypothetical protein